MLLYHRMNRFISLLPWIMKYFSMLLLIGPFIASSAVSASGKRNYGFHSHLIVLEANPAVNTANIPSSELFALQSLYNATHGDDWDWLDGRNGHWDFSGDPQPCDPQDTWQGLYCTTSKNQYFIEQIDLSGYNLIGTIPSEIQFFPYLDLLDLSENTIIGSIPESIYNLTNLFELALYENYLEGTISSLIGQLINLETLYYESNNLRGKLPTEILLLKSLATLELSNNQLTGTILDDIGSLTQLNYLELEYNKMSGTIPISIGNLTELRNLYLYNNSFNGSIPSSILEAKNLRELDLNNNQLTGPIPENIGNLGKLAILQLGLNHLTGTIPSSVGSLTNLKELFLYKTDISGSLPSTIGTMTSLVELVIYDTRLNGTIPEAIGNLVNMVEFVLCTNELSGSLPNSIGNLTQMTQLEVYENYLTGTLPGTLVNLRLLEQFEVAYNAMNGTLPAGMKQLTNLQDIQFENNSFSGSIPADLFEITSLQDVDLSNNRFGGSLPNISEACGISTLEMGFNLLTGSIPESMVNCRELTILTINNNFLSKSVPSSLFDLKLLEEVFIDSNSLTGSVPDSFCQCSSIQQISVNDNSMDGELPTNCSFKYLFNIELQYNDFTGQLPDWDFSSHGSSPLESFVINNNHFSGEVFNWLVGNTNLVFLYISSNLFSGSIGSFEYPVITELQMFSNSFTGSLPIALSNLRFIRILLGNNNQFHGPLQNVFNFSRPFEHMTHLDFSENQLTGTIPSEIFDIPSMSVFEVSVNCLHGSIPNNICNAKYLSQLAMDGLSSATQCQQRFFPQSKKYQAYYLRDHVSGTVPSCLFNLRIINTLHLSGNGLTGSLPSDLIVAANLTDLSLSHNDLTGSIPMGLQNHHWNSLDLSYNKFNGELSTFANQSEDSTITLEINRLSGVIPGSLQNGLNIDILNGNLFSCNYRRSDLPSHDQNENIYQCGSNSVNSAMYVFIALFSALGILVGILIWKKSNFMEIFNAFLSRVRDDKMYEYLCASLSKIRLYSGGFCVVNCIFLMPTYIALSHYYSMYSHSYTWQVSAIYLSGYTPAVVLLVMWTAIFTLTTAVIVYRGHYMVASEAKKAVKMSLKRMLSLVISAFSFLLNAFIVTMVNVAYVYVNHHYNSVQIFFMQIFVVIFKLVWNGVVVRSGFHYLYASLTDQNFAVQLSRVALFNNVAAPFIATAFISSDCFYNVIVTPDKVTTNFSFTNCITEEFDTDTGVTCITSSTASTQTSYVPPFSYSFQCASTFIAAYTDVYVYMFIVVALVVPGLQLLIHWVQTRYDSTALRFLKNLQWPLVKHGSPTTDDESLLKKSELFQADGFIAEMVTAVGILLSFGVVYPPLSAVIVTAMLIRTYIVEALIGRLLIAVKSSVDGQKKILIETEHLSRLGRALWTVVPVVVVFYAYLLFDTLGDQVGWRAALWLPFTVLVIGLIGGVVVTVYQRWNTKTANTDANRELSDDKL